MKDGIYHVSFSSSTGLSAEGLAVIKGSSVNGGDPGYLYRGQVNAEGDNLSGQILIERWNPSGVSVFGPMDKFELSLSGRFNASSSTFSVSGGIPDRPGLTISINGRFLSPVV